MIEESKMFRVLFSNANNERGKGKGESKRKREKVVSMWL